MISFTDQVSIPDEYIGAIAAALSLVGRPGIRNIWDHKILKENLDRSAACTVIRFQRFVKKELIRIAGPYCTYCHHRFRNANRAVIDHFVVKSVGGGFAKFTYESQNFLLCCRDCNDEKGEQLTVEPSSSQPIVYENLRFSHFHPNIHQVHEHFEIRNAIVVAEGRLGVKYLEMIGYMDSFQQPQIMSSFQIRHNQNTNSRLEETVELLISLTRVRSGAV